MITSVFLYTVYEHKHTVTNMSKSIAKKLNLFRGVFTEYLEQKEKGTHDSYSWWNFTQLELTRSILLIPNWMSSRGFNVYCRLTRVFSV